MSIDKRLLTIEQRIRLANKHHLEWQETCNAALLRDAVDEIDVVLSQLESLRRQWISEN